jgi:hypothetical protein
MPYLMQNSPKSIFNYGINNIFKFCQTIITIATNLQLQLLLIQLIIISGLWTGFAAAAAGALVQSTVIVM